MRRNIAKIFDNVIKVNQIAANNIEQKFSFTPNAPSAFVVN